MGRARRRHLAGAGRVVRRRDRRLDAGRGGRRSMTTATSPPPLTLHHDDGVPDCPYVGLVPFDEKEAAFFFGRDREIEMIVANITAARLTLLFAPSGVGKSSVLRAGVLPRLRLLGDDDFD